MNIQELNAQGVRFHHFHLAKNGRLVATVAVSDNYVDGMFVVEVACAIASKHDQPTRAKGRQIAYGRLMSQNTIRMTLHDFKVALANRSIVEHFSGGSRLKNRLRPPKSYFRHADTIAVPPNLQTTERYSEYDDLPF